jgi:hypothetical protein
MRGDSNISIPGDYIAAERLSGVTNQRLGATHNSLLEMFFGFSGPTGLLAVKKTFLMTSMVGAPKASRPSPPEGRIA